MGVLPGPNARILGPREIDAQGLLERCKPTWADIESAFPGAVVRHEDGRIEARIDLDPSTDQGRKNRGLMRELLQRLMRTEAEQSLARWASTDMVSLYDARGERHDIPAPIADREARRTGMRESPGKVISNGGGA